MYNYRTFFVLYYYRLGYVGNWLGIGWELVGMVGLHEVSIFHEMTGYFRLGSSCHAKKGWEFQLDFQASAAERSLR